MKASENYHYYEPRIRGRIQRRLPRNMHAIRNRTNPRNLIRAFGRNSNGFLDREENSSQFRTIHFYILAMQNTWVLSDHSSQLERLIWKLKNLESREFCNLDRWIVQFFNRFSQFGKLIIFVFCTLEARYVFYILIDQSPTNCHIWKGTKKDP